MKGRFERMIFFSLAHVVILSGHSPQLQLAWAGGTDIGLCAHLGRGLWVLLVVLRILLGWTECSKSYFGLSAWSQLGIHTLMSGAFTQTLFLHRESSLCIVSLNRVENDFILTMFWSCLRWALPACPPQIITCALGNRALLEDESASCQCTSMFIPSYGVVFPSQQIPRLTSMFLCVVQRRATTAVCYTM